MIQKESENRFLHFKNIFNVYFVFGEIQRILDSVDHEVVDGSVLLIKLGDPLVCVIGGVVVDFAHYPYLLISSNTSKYFDFSSSNCFI